MNAMTSWARRRLGAERIAAIKGTLRRVPATLSARRNYRYDLDRFERASTMYWRDHDREMLGSLIMMDCHRIEKGLALRNPKMGFGEGVLLRLQRDVPRYERRFGAGLPTISARRALVEYVRFHEAAGHKPPASVTALLAAAPDGSSEDWEAGTVAFSRADLVPDAGMDFERFARQRYSIRNYTGELIDRSVAARAVAIAQKTPSVCNRQSARVHVALDRETIAAALKWQNGNRGFGDTAGAVFVVTSDMRIFKDIGERNQCWVDGGMFAMSLCYALHGLGIGSCMLNWSQPMDRDADMRCALGIPDNEAVITMMAAGHIPDTLRVAISPRRRLDQVLRVIGE
jgi:nitroreductase